MKAFIPTRNETHALGALALFGLIVPNGVFIYFFLADPTAMQIAFTNPISLVFIFEAFFLMFIFAWLLQRSRIAQPRGFAFLGMSIVGSMAFSVPATLYLLMRKEHSPRGEPSPSRGNPSR